MARVLYLATISMASLISDSVTCPVSCDCRHVTRSAVERRLLVSCYVWDIKETDLDSLGKLGEEFSLQLHCDSGVPMELEAHMFRNQPNLTSLSLINCKISYIYKLAFSGLPNLRELKIHSASNYYMHFHPISFNDLPNLEILECTHSGILSVPSLCMLEHLKVVNLTGNSLVSFNTSGLACDKGHLNYLQKLDLSDNRFQDLDDLEIFGRAFPNIRVFNMAKNDVIFTADDKPFVHFPALAAVDLSFNNIGVLPGLLHTNEEIQDLGLSGNMIKTIPEDFFFHSKKVLKLELQDNELEDSVWSCLAYLQTLIYLDISNNKLTMLNQTTIETLTNLRHLHLQGNSISGIPVRTFQNHEYLQSLNLAGNQIQGIDNETLIGLFALNRLELQENGIHSMNPDFLTSVKGLTVLNISENYLTNLPSLEKLGDLRVLDASNNNIHALSEKGFVSQKNIVNINLSNNRISRLPDSIFVSCANLERLDISRNLLKYIHPSLFIGLRIQKLFLQQNSLEVVGSAFTNLKELQELNLSSNEIYDAIQKNMFPKSLEMLDISYNRIDTVRPRAFDGLDNVRMVDLRYNQINTLSVEALRVSTSKYAQTGFRINNNPLLCDCELTWLRNWDQSTHGPIIVNLNNTWCRGAYNYPASPVKLVPEDRFLCSYDNVCSRSCKCCSFDACDCKYTCPENCSCYHSKDYYTTHYVKCSDENIKSIDMFVPRIATEVDYSGSSLQHLHSAMFVGMENLKTLFLNKTKLQTISKGSFIGMPKLRSLHLEQNSLSVLNKSMFVDLKHLEELYLHYNEISVVPEGVFAEMTSLKILTLANNRIQKMTQYLSSILFSRVQLYLQGNPWTCDCVLYFSVREIREAFAEDNARSWINCSNGISRTTNIKDYAKICESTHFTPGTVKHQEEHATKPEMKLEPSTNNAYDTVSFDEMDKLLSPVKDGTVAVSRDGYVTEKEMDADTFDERVKIFLPAIIVATVMFIMIVLIACRREFVKCWLFTKFRCKSDSLELLDDQLRYFDAFVSYHSRDENYVVRELAARLERGKRGYLLQLQHRDHPRDTSELTYIETSVRSSHRTIVVLSHDFIQDNSLLKCVTQCVRQDSLGRLIVITLGKMDSSKLDPILQQNLKQGKHIRFGERWFWDKLYYCLPEPGKTGREISRAEAHPYASTDLTRLSSAVQDNGEYQEPYSSTSGQPMPTLYEYNLPSDHYDYGGSQGSSNIYEEIKDQQSQNEAVSVKYAEPWKESELQANVRTLTLKRKEEPLSDSERL